MNKTEQTQTTISGHRYMEQAHTEQARSKHCRSDNIVVYNYTMAKRALSAARDVTPRQSERNYCIQENGSRPAPFRN